MGEESVILTRDSKGVMHAFLNTCRHRGMKVCRYDEGNTSVFTCPYHGWSFANDGRLVGVPYYREAYHEELDRSQWGLIEVAHLENYKGSIWATWDKEAPSLLDYLGDMKLVSGYFARLPDGRAGGSEVLGGIQKWYMPCNWKFAAENFIGDAYHNISHRSVDLVGIGPSGRGGVMMSARRRKHSPSPSLSGAMGPYSSCKRMTCPITPTYRNHPIVEDYFRSALRRTAAASRHGRPHARTGGHGLSQHVVPVTPAALHCRVAAAWRFADRSLALVSGR